MFFFASVCFTAFLSVGFLTGDLSPEGGGATLNASSQQHIRLLAQHSTYRDPGKDGGGGGGLSSPLHVADFVFMLPTLWIEWLPKGKFVRGAAGGLSLSFES